MRMCQMQIDRISKETQNMQQPVAISSANDEIIEQNAELKDMLKQNAEDFKQLLH